MTKNGDELKENAKRLSARAREIEKRWREARGLTPRLNRKGNAKASKRRRAECPHEPKANVRHRAYRDKQLGKMGAASKMRRIAPTTGQPVGKPCRDRRDRPLHQ
jgi:hypothetical protein